MKGKGLAIVTLKMLLISWMLRLTAWIIASGARPSAHGGTEWLIIPSTALLLMALGNMLVIATWNLAANIREADEKIDRMIADVRNEQPSWELRPGGVHISTGPHLRYVAPHLSGTGTMGVAGSQVRFHFHPVAGTSDLGYPMDLGDDICYDPACTRPRRNARDSRA